MSLLFYSAITLLVVFTIYRPFISRLDIMKYIAIGGATLILPMIFEYQHKRESAASASPKNATTSVYTQHQSNFPEWEQPHTCYAIVLFLMSASVVSVCGLLSRWHFPITFIKPNSNPYISGLLRHGISLCFLYLALSQVSSDSNAPIALTTIGLFWYLSGSYFLRRWKVISSTILISTIASILICSSNPYSFLSANNCFFFSTVCVLACHMFDHLDAILNTFPHMVTSDPSHVQNPLSIKYWYCMARLVFMSPSENDLDPLPIQDLHTAIEFLGDASRSWKTMAALFPVNLRQDLCLLYAFFRTADDLIDDAPTIKQSEKNLMMIRRFLKDVFLSAKQPVDWNYYRTKLPSQGHVAIFRNFTRIAHYLCPRAMSELTDAWELDLRGDPVKKQKDLLNYAAYISGTFGELCTCVIMYKTGHGNWGPKNSPARNEDILLRARATGQCLQLVNIARDIIADSLVGRCYVPLQYMPYPAQRIYHLLKVARAPMQVGENQLKSFSLRILSLADRVSDKAQKGIDGLPSEVQDSIRAAFEIYMAIGPTLRDDPGFPLRAKVPKRVQQWIAFRCIYGFRGPVARAITTTFDEVVSIYTRAFARISGVRKGPMTQ